MPRTALTTSADRLLHCSPDRTLIRTTDPATGDPVVCKVFVRGSPADAEREVACGQLVAHLGVVRYLGTGVDAATGRPCVFSALHAGTDLDTLVGEAGAIPGARVAALLQPVAATLAAMHALRRPDLPFGLVHGDVKPKNLLAAPQGTLLLDFEHARPIGGSPDPASPFTGGTLGFSPPEAARGAPPDAAFDVYGLGATMRWLLRGGGRSDLPQDPDLERLVQACLAEQPAERPPAAMVAAALAELAARLADDPAEVALAALAAGDVAGATAALAHRATGPRAPALQRCCAHRTRILATLPHLLTVPQAEPTEPAAVRRELTTAQRVLARFPNHAPTLRWRRQLATAAGRLLATAAEHAANLLRAEEFDLAAAWLADLQDLAAFAQALPGGCPLPAPDDLRSIGLLHRSPQQFLHHQVQRLDAAREDLAAAAASITEAEQRLDLTAAELAIEHMAAGYGGAAPTVARRRDQLHRLAFYLQRIARAHGNVERLAQLWDAVALGPLLQFVGTCANAAARSTRAEGPAGPVGLRSLQVTLENLTEEFPHLHAEAHPALEALGGALEHTTDQSWGLLGDAQQKLQAVPVPVRPLQVALGRLDTFRILDAFVDRPQRPRSELQDGIESLRLALEQARATRDRLAHGAEQALARGHWTTGLFDMERAVAGMNQGDDPDGEEARRLRDRLAEARRRKQEVEAAVRRNVELATRHATLQDDVDSSFATRLQVLAERRDCLHFLTMHLPAERGALYGRDLREVETQIALEQAGLAENELDGTDDPLARLRLARTTLDRLGASFSASDTSGELPGRMLRLLEHWRTLAAQCQREVERLHAEQQSRQRHRRRLLAMAFGASIVSLTAIGFAARPWLWGEATAAVRIDGPHAPAAVLAAPDAAIAALGSQVDLLPPTLRAGARAVVAAVRRAQDGEWDPLAWHGHFAGALTGLAEPAAASDPARTFLGNAWRTGLVLALARSDDAGARSLVDATRALASALAPRGIGLGADLDGLVRQARR